MNGNISRQGITDDLEAMAQAGLGGAQIFNVGPDQGCDIPAGPVDYLSRAWLDLLHHAARQAERLGLELGLHNCAGWSTSGGPWVKPSQAMQKLVFSQIHVEGERNVELVLPQPQANMGFYHDIAVLAFPTPANDKARLPRWTTAALYGASRTARQPSLQPMPAGAAIEPASIIDITRHMRRDGTLTWKAPAGSWTIVRLGHTPTGMPNHPAPVSGRGLEVDKMNAGHLESYWEKGIQPILDRLGPLAPKVLSNLLIDSYEAGPSNWTENFLAEFQERRGYPPGPYLVALTGRIVGSGPATERFLWDFRRTIADLIGENYYGQFVRLCHAHGLLCSVEPYLGPFESLRAASKVDVPMGECWVQKIYAGSLKLAASAAHINGRNLVGAEAFTASPELGRWLNHPGSLKRMGDLAWTKGVNRLILHAFAHQPWPDKVPGMTMGQWGCQFNRNNTWWPLARAWMDYLARSQFLLQSGRHVADVLCFLGEAAPMAGNSRLESIKASGYDYDLCGTDTFARLAVKDGHVVLPCGRHYALLVLPNTPFQTPAMAEKVRQLVRAGAAVLGPRPRYSPTLAGFPQSEQHVLEISRQVWGACDGKQVTSNRFGKGRVFSGLTPHQALEQLGVRPALRLPEDGLALAWIHRRCDEAEIYFLSNQSGKPLRAMVGFRASGKQPELWDAMRRTIRPAAAWTDDGHHVHLPVELDTDDSLFVIFRQPAKSPADPFLWVNGPADIHTQESEKSPPPWRPTLECHHGLHVKVWENGTYTLCRASGAKRAVSISDLPQPLTLQGPWEVQFQANRGAPEKVRLARLISWPEHENPGIRYFSGIATYRLQFEPPQEFFQPRRQVWLDLGRVEVLARVRLNGQELGTLWHRPYRMEIKGHLRKGTNLLEVDVANLWVNRLIGDEQYPDDCQWNDKALAGWPDWLSSGKQRPSARRITFTTWKHWKADDPLLPSGLLGPVTLRCAQCLPLKTTGPTAPQADE